MTETSVGVAAGLALAAALPELPVRVRARPAIAHRAQDVTAAPLLPVDGALTVRAVTPDPVLLARYAVSDAPDTQVAMR